MFLILLHIVVIKISFFKGKQFGHLGKENIMFRVSGLLGMAALHNNNLLMNYVSKQRNYTIYTWPVGTGKKIQCIMYGKGLGPWYFAMFYMPCKLL